MSPEVTALIAMLSGIAGVIATLAAVRVQWRKDSRDQDAADDLEADRIIRLKDVRIAELSLRVDGLQLAVNDLRDKIRSLELQVDQYGCWNGPHCENRRPLGGPKPEKTEI